MASGHVNRANRPNTWPHRPSCNRAENPCQQGAVHTWHIPELLRAGRTDRLRLKSGLRLAVLRTLFLYALVGGPHASSAGSDHDTRQRKLSVVADSRGHRTAVRYRWLRAPATNRIKALADQPASLFGAHQSILLWHCADHGSAPAGFVLLFEVGAQDRLRMGSEGPAEPSKARTRVRGAQVSSVLPCPPSLPGHAARPRGISSSSSTSV